VSFYLDGAHTPESVVQCGNWFASVAGGQAAAPAAPQVPPYNVLLFYTMQKREPMEILAPLHSALARKVGRSGLGSLPSAHHLAA
jgi:folylpolyglutamate synthase